MLFCVIALILFITMNGGFIANISANGTFIFQGIVNVNNNQIVDGNLDEQVQRNSFVRQSLSIMHHIELL